MRRSGKIILSIIATVVVIVAITLIVVLTNLDRVIKYGVETYGPSATGTPVSLDNARVSIRSGQGELNGLVIGNPQGFDTDYAFKLNKIKINLDPQSLTRDIIVVEQIIVDSASLNSEFKGRQSNLQQIRDNLNRYTTAAKEEERKREQEGQPPEEAVKFLIKEFHFTNGEVTLLSDVANIKQSLEIPDFTLTNIGETTNGATIAEVSQQLLQPMISKALKGVKAEGLKESAEQIKERAKEKLDETFKNLIR
jgi:uncharacterized protein involved in outer membrane biogenesis